jgi:hypothetical protein
VDGKVSSKCPSSKSAAQSNGKEAAFYEDSKELIGVVYGHLNEVANDERPAIFIVEKLLGGTFMLM